ncbi:MAG: NAD(P)/FAD-dependent oxidoreductase [Pseudomonadales bacterium]|nr:NAD(P)/FAD-dependent oxidoreductase [Pseudomonadales bacterium]
MEQSQSDDGLFAQAIEIANIPTLLMVLVQLTGEERWLEPPYRPTRLRGMGDNDTGGLTDAAQLEVREAALTAILAWRAGKPTAIPDPSNDMLVRMLSVTMAEDVPSEYGNMTAAQLGQLPFLDHTPIDTPANFSVVIIGAGVSGLCAAINLDAAGIPFTVYEKSATVGGVWWDNRYPGAGVDTPNHLYSYSFASYDWKKYFALRDELHTYLEDVASRFDVKKNVHFNTEVNTTTYQAAKHRWAVEVTHADGSHETVHASLVISAAGIFNPPVYPEVEGLAEFTGKSWHSAQWPDNADLTGKRVAIVGNGASCMQIAPEIQNDVASLTIFQRSNHWAAPFEQFRREVPEPLRFLMNEVPLYQAWYRVRLGWTFNDRIHNALQKDPNWPHPERALNAQNDAHRAYFTEYVTKELGDRADELLNSVLPTYPPFGKRMLMDNGWYRMLRNPQVNLVTDSVQRIEENRLITGSGTEYEADVLIIATGFDVLRFITTYEAVGRSGRSLREVWEDDNAKAYMGTVIPDFPNFFTLYGPNLQPGHGGSLIFVIEMQMHYIMDVIRKMTSAGLRSVECRQEVHDAYNEGVDDAHKNMVWTHSGVQSYYRNPRGRIVVNSPYRNVDFFDMTHTADLADYLTEQTEVN